MSTRMSVLCWHPNTVVNRRYAPPSGALEYRKVKGRFHSIIITISTEKMLPPLALLIMGKASTACNSWRQAWRRGSTISNLSKMRKSRGILTDGGVSTVDNGSISITNISTETFCACNMVSYPQGYTYALINQHFQRRSKVKDIVSKNSSGQGLDVGNKYELHVNMNLWSELAQLNRP